MVSPEQSAEQAHAEVWAEAVYGYGDWDFAEQS
jgi:hypothetical protein